MSRIQKFFFFLFLLDNSYPINFSFKKMATKIFVRNIIILGGAYYGVSSLFSKKSDHSHSHHGLSQETLDKSVTQIAKPLRVLMESDHAMSRSELSEKVCTPFDPKTKEICKKIIENEELYQEFKKNLKEKKLPHYNASSFK